MTSSSTSSHPSVGDALDAPRLARALHHALEHAAHYLPAQGPIGVFVHHNTLHAFAHLPFHQATREAAALLDAQPYLPEARFREALARGRITEPELDHAHRAWRGARSLRTYAEAHALTDERIQQLALRHPIEPLDAVGLRWELEDRLAHRRLRADLPPHTRAALLERGARWAHSLAELASDEELARAVDPQPGSDPLLPRTRAQLAALLERDAEALTVASLWAHCQRPAPQLRGSSDAPLSARLGVDRTPRDALGRLGAFDPVELVHTELIRTASAFLDLGMARWAMPNREKGFYLAWRALMLAGWSPALTGLSGVKIELARHVRKDWDATRVVLDALEELGVREAQWPTFLQRVLCQLPGWAGMFHRLEHFPGDREASAHPVRLLDFLAVRLTLDRQGWFNAARRSLGYEGPRRGLVAFLQEQLRREESRVPEPNPGDEPWRFFQLAQLAGLGPGEVSSLSLEQRSDALQCLEDFDSLTRRSVWQEAYEDHYRDPLLAALAQNRARPRALRRVERPRFQVVCCFDDREESLRRHLEALRPDLETFGHAGFYGVAMHYQGLDHGWGADLCPVVVSPSHVVRERAHPDDKDDAETRLERRMAWAQVRHFFFHASRGMLRALVLTPLTGLLALLPMAGRILFPRATGRLSARAQARLLPEPRTVLVAERSEEEHPNPSPSLRAQGFNVRERAERIEGTLRNLGLLERFGRLVVLLGHGAASVNNPHASAYNCGACGGNSGGPNARLAAQWANSPVVRALLRKRGIHVPEDTWFLGGEHNTTTDALTFFDLEQVPAPLRPELEELTRTLEQARRLNAQERCRKFESAPREPTPEQALRHVESRAHDLSQARPELNHATIASGVVGRRELTRGLFLDRRAFVISYDPSTDPEGEVLERILLAAGPVGSGINLEYFFSCTDPDRFGAGTKLPHNLAGLLGVMDGANSDLRTGLPTQMTEVHEPLRLHLVVEARRSVLEAILRRQEPLRELVLNRWVKLVALDPEDGELQLLEPEGFVPFAPPAAATPEKRSSYDHFHGTADFLPPALLPLRPPEEPS